MTEMETGAAIALDAAVKMLRLVADQAEAHGNRDTSSFIHAAATLVRGMDPKAIIEASTPTHKGEEG